jgi:nitrate/nitrite-specific signal transduction histidine kinase
MTSRAVVRLIGRFQQLSLAEQFLLANFAILLANMQVKVDHRLVMEVTDAGPGVGPARVPANGHPGLAGIRERVESQCGQFEIISAPGRGTRVRATMALDGEDAEHD